MIMGPAPLSRRVVPALSLNLRSGVNVGDTEICAETALAWLQYRARYRSEPRGFEDLVPEFLPRIPVSFMNARPLRLAVSSEPIKCGNESRSYTLSKGTIRIYSLGINGKDDGGTGERSDETSKTAFADDAVIFVPPMKSEAQRP